MIQHLEEQGQGSYCCICMRLHDQEIAITWQRQSREKEQREISGPKFGMLGKNRNTIQMHFIHFWLHCLKLIMNGNINEFGFSF